MSKIFKSIGFGLGLETIANFWRVSISESLVSEKSIDFGFREFGLGKTISVLENLVSEKKSRYRFRKIWYRKKSLGIGFGQNFGIVIQWLIPIFITDLPVQSISFDFKLLSPDQHKGQKINKTDCACE